MSRRPAELINRRETLTLTGTVGKGQEWLVKSKPYSYPIVARLAAGLAFFITAPIITNRFGLRGLGLWSLYTTAAYAPLVLDVGLIDCLMREAGLAVAGTGSWSRTRRVLMATTCIYMLYATVLGFVAAFWHHSVIALFNVPTALEPAAKSLLVILPVAMFMSGLASISQTLHLTAGESNRYYRTSTMVSLGGVLAAAVVLVLPGATLGRLAVVSVAVQALLPLLMIRLGLLWDLVLVRYQPDDGRLREAMSYGVRIAVANVTFFVMNSTDRFFLAAYTDLQVVAGYEIGTRALSVARTTATAVLPTQFARFVHQPGRSLYRSMESRFSLLSVSLIVGVLALTPFFVQIWLGRDMPPYALASAVVVAINSITILSTGIPVVVARVLGMPNRELISVVVNLVLNVTLTIILGPRIGFVGVVGATTIATLCGSTLFHISWRRSASLGQTFPGGLAIWAVAIGALGLPLLIALVVVRALTLTKLPLTGVFGLAWTIGVVVAGSHLSRRRVSGELAEPGW